MRIAGSVAIVTGGARGFGKAFTEALLNRGARVCFADINEEEGAKTAQQLSDTFGPSKAVFTKCDVTKEEELANLFSVAKSKFNQSVNLMVNNAGILNERSWEKMVEINLIGAMRGTQCAIQNMRKDKGGDGGLVVNVASTAGLFPVFFMPAYAASKYGVVGYTRSWAFNPLTPSLYGMSFACLCPAFSNTNMLTDVVDGKDPPLVSYAGNKETVDNIIHGIGINTVDQVVDAFVDLVEKEDNNGAVVTIEQSHGAIYRYKKHPHKL